MSKAANRWFPPSPHKEKVLEAIDQGVAHLVERGHNVPPLLVFEDGGAIELPKARYQRTRRGMALVAGDGPTSKGATHFYDVCGTVDELKGQLAESTTVDAKAVAYYQALIGDLGYMLSRMARRRDQYCAFAHEVQQAAQELIELPVPDTASSEERLAWLAEQLVPDKALTPETRTAIYAQAEAVRELANGLEAYLRAGKEMAMRLTDLVAETQGGRVWSRTEERGT